MRLVQYAGTHTLSTGLEEQPLNDLRLFSRSGAHKARFVLGVVTLHDIHHDRIRLPDREIIVVAIDESRDASVGVVVDVGGLLLLVLVKVEHLHVALEAELLDEEADLPLVGHVHAHVVEHKQWLKLAVGCRGRHTGWMVGRDLLVETI